MDKHYRTKMAASCIVENVPVVAPKATIGDVQKLLSEYGKDFSTIAYIYIVSADRHLEGVVSIKEIFTHTPHTLVAVASKKSIVMATSNMSCEEVAVLAWKHNLKAVPVVDALNKKFLGVITPDKILDILHQGRTLDALRQAGAGGLPDPHNNLSQGTPLVHIKKRLPWLLVGLGGGLVAASIVQAFETEMEHQVLIAAFIPLVVYLADAVGSQTEIIFVRAIALDTELKNWSRYLTYVWREVVVTFVLATILAICVAFMCVWWFEAPELVWLLSVSIVTTLMMSMAVAVGIPYLAVRLNYDPALTSGPVATVVRDVLTLVVYFLVVSLYLSSI